MQPYVGYWSDHITFRYGRQRVLYVLLGMPLSVLGIVLFGLAIPLGQLRGDKGEDYTYGAAFALASLWSVNLGLNVVTITGHSLQLDICNNPANDDKDNLLEAARGTSAVNFASALGSVGLTALGFVDVASACAAVYRLKHLRSTLHFLCFWFRRSPH